MHRLYWIRNAEHTDPYTEGYIGVTKRTLNKRLLEHIKRRLDLDLSDTFIETLHEGEKQEISELEKIYRPKSWIGWNKAPGGLNGGRPTGIHTSGWTHSDETKAKMSESLKGNKFGLGHIKSEETKVKISSSHKGMSKPWAKNPVMKGSDNPRSRKVMAEGVVYDTLKAAGEAHGFSNHNAVAYRCKSPKWSNWTYI